MLGQMKAVPLHVASKRMESLLDEARAGADIVITRGREQLVRLVPVEWQAPRRQFGALRGRIVVPPEFFEPLPPNERSAWE
jgi:antitoxin (DNA-binding transcriptional repressor) of toxin-antitoxin stability system